MPAGTREPDGTIADPWVSRAGIARTTGPPVFDEREQRVQLGSGRPSGPPAEDVCEALRSGAAALGHRPAVTVLHPGARYEQSGASLANWAAKGAHLLELDHAVGPGSTVGLLAPPCWTTATVALSTWWLGATVALDAPGEPTVVHQDAPIPPGAGAVLQLGDGLDGAPTGGGDAWTRSAQLMPDHPPSARCTPTSPALTATGRSDTQRSLLALARTVPDGRAGVDRSTDPVTALVAVALRPMVTGATTVVLRGVAREDAAAERVEHWL